MAAESKVRDLTVGSPLKLMIEYAVPVLLGNIFQQIYSFADTVIVGQKLGTSALAAVGTTGTLNFLVNGFVMGVTSGFAVPIAQAFGAKDYDHMRKTTYNAVFLWAIITVVMTTLAIVFARPLLLLVNTPDSIIDMSYTYIVTIFAGVAATMLYNGISCILRALGDSRTPLYFLVMSALLNIGLDLLFIMTFKMGVFGAAFATVLAQAVSGFACVIYTKIKFPIMKMTSDNRKLEGRIMTKHLSIGLPMGFQFSITAIGTTVLQSAINNFGENPIAAFTAATKVEQLVTQIGPACGATVATYVGQNIGAGRYDRIKKGVNQFTILTIGMAVLSMILIYFFGESICSLFISGDETAEVIKYSMEYLNIAMVFFVALYILFIYRNALQAMGKTLMPLMAGVLELVARTVVALTLPTVIGFTGVCVAGPIAWIAAALPLAVTYFMYMRSFKKKGYL